MGPTMGQNTEMNLILVHVTLKIATFIVEQFQEFILNINVWMSFLLLVDVLFEACLTHTGKN